MLEWCGTYPLGRALMLGFKLALVGFRPSSTPRCAGVLGVPERSVCRRLAASVRRSWWAPSRSPRHSRPPFSSGSLPRVQRSKQRLSGSPSRQNSWNPLGRLPLSGQPGSSTPAGFARMEPALGRIPSPYPSPWRPRKSHDRARPGWEVVAPRVAAPSPCRTFRLFANVLRTETIV